MWQVVHALRGGEQAWDHCGINAAFKNMDSVSPKLAPRKQRAEKFGTTHGIDELKAMLRKHRFNAGEGN